MGKWIALAAVAVITATLSAQQQPLPPYRGHGYIHFGFTGVRSNISTAYNVGVGGEGLVWKGLAPGASLEMLSAYKNIGATVGLLSPSAAWHFLDRTKQPKLVPFVSGGYTLAFNASGHDNGFHYGGGVTWWFKPKYALRTEIRDHVFHGEHIYAIRIGLAFR